MARVFTAKARKDYPQFGIKKGDTYYYWSVGFRGRKQMSKTPPKQSQLTGSKMSEAYAASEDLQEAIDNADSIESLVDALDEAASRIRDVAQEYQDAFDGLPENFQQSSNAQEMEEKAQNLNDWADSIENDKGEIEGLSFEDYADMDADVESLPEELVDEEEEQCEECSGTGRVEDIDTPCETCNGTGEVDGNACPDCEGTKLNKMDCGKCEGTGQVAVKKRRDISDFDDLTDDEKQAMLDAARELAQQNVDCPL